MEDFGTIKEGRKMGSVRGESPNNVLLVKIGLGRELVNPIYHHRNLLFFRGKPSNPSFFINQPMGIWDIYGITMGKCGQLMAIPPGKNSGIAWVLWNVPVFETDCPSNGCC